MAFELNEMYNREHNWAIAAHRIMYAGTDIQEQIELTANSAPLYIGLGAKGLAQSDDGWLVTKYTYGTDITAPTMQSAIGPWSNRSSLTYS